jgi:hypothetical protein
MITKRMQACVGNGKTTIWTLNGIGFQSTTMLICSCYFHHQLTTTRFLCWRL